jgi:hypothetical protein
VVVNSKLIKDMFVYEYTFLDDLSFILSPEEFARTRVFPRIATDELNDLVEAVKSKFLSAGWEGDGDLGIIWMPPFVDFGEENIHGNYIWHVKQSNNGISFILSEREIEFRRIKEQNTVDTGKAQLSITRSIIKQDSDTFVLSINNIKDDLHQKCQELNSIADLKVKARIINDLLIHSQGLLVRNINEFFDGCYLSVLIQALNGNSSGIKLRKSRVNLSFRTQKELADIPEDNSWLTLNGIISDLWNAYMFEPYKSKVDMLFNSVSFKCDKKDLDFINKHITFRNCVQHKEGRLDRESLKQLGVEKIKVLGVDEELTSGSIVTLTLDEIDAFSCKLINMGTNFEKHVFKNVPARCYVRQDKA